MQVTVTVSDAVTRKAMEQGKNIVEYVELLIDKGSKDMEEPVILSAIERIRALRGPHGSDEETSHHSESE